MSSFFGGNPFIISFASLKTTIPGSVIQAQTQNPPLRLPTTSCGQPADRSFTPHSPFRTARGTWLRPEIEAEIKFTEWTAGGLLRHAEFVNSKAVHHAYSKHAEVTVPSLDDWEKEWKKNPQAVMQPKAVALNFKSPAPGAASSSEAQATALAQVG